MQDSIPKSAAEKEAREAVNSLIGKPKAFIRFLRTKYTSRFSKSDCDLLEELCEEEEEINPTRLRDKYIACTIDSTLSQNETGILFLGKAHKVDEVLSEMDRDIVIDKYDISVNMNRYNEKFMKLINSKIPYTKLLQLMHKRKVL